MSPKNKTLEKYLWIGELIDFWKSLDWEISTPKNWAIFFNVPNVVFPWSSQQSIYKILSTERYENVIYSRNYGVEFKDIFGQPVTTVLPIIESRIKEALIQDDRINSVDNFVFDTSKKHIVSVSFTVHSIIGNIEMSKEVAV